MSTMTLRQWLDREGIGSQKWLQEATGLSRMTVSAAANGQRVSLATADRIAAATEWEVDPLSIAKRGFPELEAPPKPNRCTRPAPDSPKGRGKRSAGR